MSNITVTHKNYKGNALLELQAGEASYVNRPFSFGVKKAQMILESIDEIKAFVDNAEKYQAEAKEAKKAEDLEKAGVEVKVVLNELELEELKSSQTTAKRRNELIEKMRQG